MTSPNDPQYQPVPQPRKRHRVRNTLLITVGVLAAIVGFAAVGAAAHPKTTPPVAAPAAPAVTASPAAPASPAPSPSAVTPTKVEFIVSGYAPGDGYGNGPSVTYGSDSDSHQPQVSDIDGTVTYSVPFDPSAMYYSIDAELVGSGHLTCKIVVTGPYPDAPTTVSTGHAEGGYSDCSAQAAPDDSTGLNWQNEN